MLEVFVRCVQVWQRYCAWHVISNILLGTGVSRWAAHDVQEETGITRVADPWGGSYFMESLTASLEAAAEKLLREVEDMGGMTEAIIAGTCLLA